MLGRLRELYSYRALVANLVVSELKLRYRRSVLGFLWSFLNPLLMMSVLAFVFSTVMRVGMRDYTIMLLAGLLPWGFFQQSVTQALMSIVGKGALLKKVYIPKAVIPLSAVLATFVNFTLSLVPMLVIILVLGHPVGASFAFVPVAMLMLLTFALGWALIFACLYVFFRDFGHMTEVLLQAWFYASPVIYTLDMVPERFRPFFRWNPLLYILECFREPIYYGRFPNLDSILVGATASLGTLVIGWVVFIRYENRFVLRV